jgi:hypothetical protein
MLDRLKVLFEKLVAELPANTARLNVYRVPKGDGSVIELLPTNQQAASFGVHVDDGADLVDFSFGRLGTWELPEDGRNPHSSAEEVLLEVEQMGRAVIAGRCEQQRGLFSLTSRIFVDGYTYKVVDLPMLPLPPFGKRKYAPYTAVTG